MACSERDDNLAHTVVSYATFTEYRGRRHVVRKPQGNAADENLPEVPDDAGGETAAAICMAVALPVPNGDKREGDP
ncbi:MAG: hypothetical protein EHM55_14285 [Acidobacteria bacterium]|nr:MAG: hypothetical protein EHM55_14285 [Acidobacteriota bacterium]